MEKIPGFYYRFLASRMLVSVVMNAFLVYFLWIIVRDYNSVFLAGMTATIYLAVSLAASIPIGHLIDRMNSTLISLISSIIAIVAPLLLLFGSSLLIIYTATAFVTLGLTMKGDSFAATMKKHLSEDQFLSGNSSSLGATYTSSLLGTAIGGAAIVYFSGYISYVLLVLGAVSIISSIPIGETPEKRHEGGVLKEMSSAIGFYKKILGFVMIAFIINGLFESLDVYSSGLFHLVLDTSPIYYTIFVASISIGGILGAIVVNRLRGKFSGAIPISFMVFAYAPLFLILSINRNPLIDIIDALIIGVLLSLINVPLQSKLMKIIPRNIYGKIMAFLRIFISGSTPLMAAVFSFISIFESVDVILFYIGLLLFPVTALAFAVLPKFMRLESEEQKYEVF